MDQFHPKHTAPKKCLLTVEKQFNYEDLFAGRSPKLNETLVRDEMRNDAMLFMHASWLAKKGERS